MEAMKRIYVLRKEGKTKTIAFFRVKKRLEDILELLDDTYYGAVCEVEDCWFTLEEIANKIRLDTYDPILLFKNNEMYITKQNKEGKIL